MMENETEWSMYTKPSFNKQCETSDTNTSTGYSGKIKVEIELKEEKNGLVYQPDFFGHLRLVSLNQSVPNNCRAIENKYTGLPEWHCIQSISEVEETNVVPTVQNNIFTNDCVYGHLESVQYDIPDGIEEKSTKSSFQNSASEFPEIYNYAFETMLQHQTHNSNQICRKRKKRQHPIILAEKKREYRLRIKEENPDMWCAMKQKEACKKREQREEKRLILLEMQKLMQLSSVADSPEVENHKLYLEALKEKHPEIWQQLTDALSATEQRNQELEKNPKRHLSKPIKMYKDVVEAQKKYLYRQRMKLERPELYEQQKARDSYARSIKRMLKKQLLETQSTVKK